MIPIKLTNDTWPPKDGEFCSSIVLESFFSFCRALDIWMPEIIKFDSANLHEYFWKHYTIRHEPRLTDREGHRQ